LIEAAVAADHRPAMCKVGGEIYNITSARRNPICAATMMAGSSSSGRMIVKNVRPRLEATSERPNAGRVLPPVRALARGKRAKSVEEVKRQAGNCARAHLHLT